MEKEKYEHESKYLEREIGEIVGIWKNMGRNFEDKESVIQQLNRKMEIIREEIRESEHSRAIYKL